MDNLTQPFSGSGAGFHWISKQFTGTSDAVTIPCGMTWVSVAIHPAAGQTARVEYTLSAPADIDAGTAKWIAWPLGNVSAANADSMLTQAMAIRGVSSSGTATLEVLAR